ncbi:MAG: hypothetical protein L3K14_03160 [Thermoplasmata archaeon]|nr:hypothetical protein [Thermoplasmata archaeon]
MASRALHGVVHVDVNLSTAELIESMLEEVGIPVSRNWLLERLRESGHQTTRPRLNRVLKHYLRLGLAVEGSKGVQWTHNMSPQLLHAVAVGKRL